MAYTQAHGWTPAEKDLVVVNDLKSAEERLNAADPIAFLWEKYATKQLMDAGGFLRIDEHRSQWPSFVIVATETILAEHSKEVQHVLKVIRDQVAGLMQKMTALEIIAQRCKMKLQDARKWFTFVRWNTTGAVNMQALQAVSERLHSLGAIDHALAAEELAAMVMPVRS